MNIPNFSADQYVDSDSLNLAMANVGGSIASGMAVGILPGLFGSTGIIFMPSGMQVLTTFPTGAGVVFGNGVVAEAHGTVNGADTQGYTTDFSGSVPASGSVTAYLVASLATIYQDPVAIIGPPPGHPDFNPFFVPYTAYQKAVDSLALTATTTPPDNQTTFELLRTTLVAGQVLLPANSLDYSHQVRRAPHSVIYLNGLPSGASLRAEFTSVVTGSGTYTLPLAATSNGQILGVASNTSGAVTVATSGTDAIYGFYNAASGGVTSFALKQNASLYLASMYGRWQVYGGSAEGLGIPDLLPTSGVAHSVVLFEGTSPFGSTGAGASGYVLTAQGASADPIWVPNAVTTTQVNAFANKFYNATCAVAMRGSPLATSAGSSGYTIDGCIIGCAGSGVTSFQASPIGLGTYSLGISGQAGVTDAFVVWPIESIDSFGLANNEVTFQVKLLNNTGVAVQPSLSVKTAGGAGDNWTTSNYVVSGQLLQSVNAGASGQLSWSFPMPSGAANGASVRLDFGGSLNGLGRSLQLGDRDIRVGNALLLPEMRAYFSESQQCQRYLPALFAAAIGGVHTAGWLAVGGTYNTATIGGVGFQFDTPCRTSPTGMVLSALSDFQVNYRGGRVSLSALVYDSATATCAALQFTTDGSTSAAGGESSNLIAASGKAVMYLTGAEIMGPAL